jgi:hypothetical protein
MIKSGRMRWKEHESLMRKKRNAYKVVVGKPEEKNQ